MASDKTAVASLANLGLLLMTELAMPDTALEEFVRKVCCTNGLESFASVKYWELVTAHHLSPKKKVVMGPFKPHKNKGVNVKPENLDLNQPAPETEEPCWGLDMMQAHDKVVEVTETMQRTQQKRKITEAGTGGVKRAKVTVKRAPPAKKDEVKAVIEVESTGEN